MPRKEGEIGGYPIPQYRKKNWQVPKYRVQNRTNTDTTFMIVNVYLTLYRCLSFMSSMCMLWFNFILRLNFISLCFKLIIIHYHTQKQREMKFKPRIKLNLNIYTRNQPREKTWGDCELNGTMIGKPGHWMSYQFPDHRVAVRNCVFIDLHLTWETKWTVLQYSEGSLLPNTVRDGPLENL